MRLANPSDLRWKPSTVLNLSRIGWRFTRARRSSFSISESTKTCVWPVDLNRPSPFFRLALRRTRVLFAMRATFFKSVQPVGILLITQVSHARCEPVSVGDYDCLSWGKSAVIQGSEGKMSEDESSEVTRLETAADARASKMTRVSLRWSRSALDVVREAARLQGVPYQTYVKQAAIQQATLLLRDAA